MLTLQVFLGVSLCALLILGTHGSPVKGLESHDQSSGGSYTGGHSAYQGVGSHYAPMYSGAPRPLQMPGQALSSVSSMPGAGYPVFMPAEYLSSSQTEAAQSSLPETKWSVEPKIFSEEGLANTEAIGSSDFVPAPHPPVPYGPVLQSGETSNVVKEAELGNYQQETEELGYANDHMMPGYASPFLPIVGGLGGYPGPYPYPYLYPAFDFRLLYGLYPPGTYTTFSKNHEKGKDYYQDVHYLREHGPVPSDVPSRPGEQKIIFPRAPQSS
ncbi:uncharacterized protein LOC119408979 [Nematolebias whitei]|uniref:uncharacterized protein LOC119408979 n=1 Tax=Nematolebias whitei TaxID=451745 RepID=UPI00189BC11F|nr:uncharacterized protein LOC119408979 [Nematolebias whitei]